MSRMITRSMLASTNGNVDAVPVDAVPGSGTAGDPYLVDADDPAPETISPAAATAPPNQVVAGQVDLTAISFMSYLFFLEMIG